MGDKKDMKTDIRNCFKVCSDIDEKHNKKNDALQVEISQLTTDVRLLASTTKTLADSFGRHLNDFEEHAKEEDKNLNEIRNGIESINSKLDSEVLENKLRDARVDNMQKVQSRFIKWATLATGGFGAVYFLYKAGIITLNLGGVHVE